MPYNLVDIAKDYGPFIAGGAVLISATIALVVACVTIWTQRALARKRATLDLIIKSETDKDFQELFKDFIIIRDEHKDGIMSVSPILDAVFQIHKTRGKYKLRDVVSDQEISRFKVIQYYLNYYELIAIGIDNRILDETFYKQWMRISLINAWRDSSTFVARWRWLANYDRYFSRLEFYARKWAMPFWKRALLRMRFIKLVPERPKGFDAAAKRLPSPRRGQRGAAAPR